VILISKHVQLNNMLISSFNLYLPLPYVLSLRLGFFKVNYKTNWRTYLLT